MSSRFVSAGGVEVKAPEGLSAATDDAWAKARAQVEENKKPRNEGPAPGTQEGGVSLYEHLQAQKAAKQEAFEEASKLRNQFRPLDETEVEFLERVKEKERLQAELKRKETAENLEAFRKEQATIEQQARVKALQDTEEADLAASGVVAWTAGRKRRRPLADDKAENIKSAKLAPAKSNNGPEMASKKDDKSVIALKADSTTRISEATDNEQTTTQNTVKKQPQKKVGLVSYDSDSE